MRVVIELKRDAVADVVLNQLYRFTPLQTSFGVNMVALNGGRPELMGAQGHPHGLRRLPRGGGRAPHQVSARARRATAPTSWSALPSRSPISTRSSRSSARRRTRRSHASELMERDWPANDVEPLIAAHRRSAPRDCERGTYKLSDEQARAILELRLQRLTALGRDEIAEELEKIAAEIRDYPRHPRARASASADRQGRARRRSATSSPRRAGPKSPRAGSTSRTRT